MAVYEYGRIRTLAAKLAQAGVDEGTINDILTGAKLIRKGDKPEKKAAWMAGAMRRMDALLDDQTRRSVREECACCLGGKRLEISKKIAKAHSSLEGAIEAANEARFVFGHSVTLEDDGRILVRFQPDGADSYRCVCLPKAREPISITYCYCCGGHIKHHLQTALARRLSCTVRSSALASGGKGPCTFLFSIDE
jgi:hypothetical protein